MIAALLALAIGVFQPAPSPWPVTEGDVVLKNFRFASGEQLPEVRVHYRTLGTPQRDVAGTVRNAVLILHGTGGSGAQFMRREFAGELFGPGQLLDSSRYYIILPDGLGHGGTSKPSDGLQQKFPRYAYQDMIDAQYRLLTEGLGVNHLRLVMGTSMGGMHTWLWGQRNPFFMDALLPLASLPTQIAGRNRAWRRIAIDALRRDPVGGLPTAAGMLFLVSSNSMLRQRQAPTLADADKVFDAYIENAVKTTNGIDLLYALEASRDYDPAPGLEKILPPLIAINFDDDLINPPELRILEREIARVPRGCAVNVPMSERTAGHGTHTLAAIWKEHLQKLLQVSEKGATSRPC